MSKTRSADTWQGLWIWGTHGLAHDHRNETIYARKAFRLTSEPVRARCRISADNRYELFVNGRRVCRGPARCEPTYQSYDEIDLAPFLRKGRNVVAVRAHHYGESTFQSLERGGWGFLLDGEVACRQGKPVPIHTGETWKAIGAEAYNRKTSRYVPQLGFQEDFDAAKDEDPRWITPQFDDRHWREACCVGVAKVMPYEHLEPRGIPFELEEPARFVDHTGVFGGKCGAAYRTTENVAELLADEKRSRASTPGLSDVETALKPGHGHMKVSPTPAGRFHAVVLDAGKETSGFVHLSLDAAGGEIVDLFYCEHVKGNGDAIVRAQNGAIAHMSDRYRCRKGRQTHRFFAWKGFRYLLVVFRDVKRAMKVHHIGYDFTSYPVERRGSFACSDPLLERIWETGVYTQQLCMHDAYMDCPWREQAQWWGDARVQWRVNMAAFGDHALFRRGIRQGGQSQIHNGLTYGLFPCECHGCILPDYTFVWICSIWDYYFYTGEEEPICEHYDEVVKALDYFEKLAGKDHLPGHPGVGLWLFIDWAPLYKGGYNTTFALQYLEALKTAATMGRLIGRVAEARKFAALARQVEKAAIRAFWDPRGKQFFEGYNPREGKPYRQVAQHGNSYAILTGVQKQWHGKIADRVAWILANHDELFDDNSGHNHHHPKAKYPIASSFFYAYVLEALFRAGRGDAAMAGIRKLWGRMLDTGATTWYESWNHTPEVYGNSSACHAWSASPTYHLSEQVGGVMPVSAGFEKVRIAPRMFDLDHAAVTTPSPRGAIEVAWERTDDGGMDLRVKLPKRVTGMLEVPGSRVRKLEGGRHRMTVEG